MRTVMLPKLPVPLASHSLAPSLLTACCLALVAIYSGQGWAHERSAVESKWSTNTNHKERLSGDFSPLGTTAVVPLDILSVDGSHLNRAMEQAISKQLDAVLNESYTAQVSVPKDDFMEGYSLPMRVRVHELKHMGYLVSSTQCNPDEESYNAVIASNDYLNSRIHKKIAELELLLTSTIHPQYRYTEALETTGLAPSSTHSARQALMLMQKAIYAMSRRGEGDCDSNESLEASLGFNDSLPEVTAKSLHSNQDVLVRSIEESLASNNSLNYASAKRENPFAPQNPALVRDNSTSDLTELKQKRNLTPLPYEPLTSDDLAAWETGSVTKVASHSMYEVCAENEFAVIHKLKGHQQNMSGADENLLIKCAGMMLFTGGVEYFLPSSYLKQHQGSLEQLMLNEETFAEKEGSNFVGISMHYLYHVHPKHSGTFIEGVLDDCDGSTVVRARYNEHSQLVYYNVDGMPEVRENAPHTKTLVKELK